MEQKQSLLAKILGSETSEETKTECKKDEECCQEKLCTCELDEEYPTSCNDEAGCCCCGN